jgi:hypothetical protein
LDIGARLNHIDFGNMRGVNQRLGSVLEYDFLSRVSQDKIIYPRYDSCAPFVEFLACRTAMCPLFHRLTLVTEALLPPANGYEWAWENLQLDDDIDFTTKDLHIMERVNEEHEGELYNSEHFIYSGNYRLMLTKIFKLLPNLREVAIRTLKPGEHHPGWNGPKMLKRLSFYHDKLNTNPIYYNTWQYDEILNCVSWFIDEFGELCTMEGAGPQARFTEDFLAARLASRCFTRIIFLDYPGYGC